MSIRITFNGRELTNTEAIPDDVRRELSQIANADQNGFPGTPESGVDENGNAIHRTSLTINGRTYHNVADLPGAMQFFFDRATAHTDENREHHPEVSESNGSEWETPTPVTRPHGRERLFSVLGQLDRTLNSFLRILLGIAAVAILAVAVLIQVTMDESSRSQGGRWYVAVAALVALGAVDSRFGWLVRRREPFSLTESPAHRRYRYLSLLLLSGSAVVLFGLAWLLP